MTTIQMSAPFNQTGNVTLPAPSFAVIALSGGIGAVNVQDVPVALLNNWVVLAGQNWPGAAVKHMAPPTTGSWPTNGTLTSPDGQTITVTNGIALVPMAWVNYYTGMGWKVTGQGE